MYFIFQPHLTSAALLKCCMLFHQKTGNTVKNMTWSERPTLGWGTPSPLFPTLVHSPPHLLLFFTFPIFLFLFALPIFFFRPSRPLFYQSSPPLRFQAGGRSRRPNLSLVCSVNFMLSVLFS